MYKCWNCGTEHEPADADASYNRGWQAATDRAVQKIEAYFTGVPSLAKVHVNALIKEIRNA